MTAKRIAYNQDAREAVRRGVRQLARAVKVTLGPRGRNVLIEKSFGAPQVTKDGATVAKEIDLTDRNENIGAVMVREVAQKTADVAGDGTTTAVVLAEDQVLLAVELDLGAGVAREDDPVALADLELRALAVLQEFAVADRDDLAFAGLLLGVVRQDDPALGLALGLETLDENLVVDRLDLGHRGDCLPVRC